MALAAGGLATLLTFAALEVLLRIVWDRPEGYHINVRYLRYMLLDAELGSMPKPNTVVEYPRFGASFATNSQGLRGPERSVARQAGVRRIVVLGDSFAWGHGVSTGQAFPEVLEQLLPNTEVINLGVPGFNVRTERKYFDRVGARYQPDVVVLALCQNDIYDLDGLEQRRRNQNAAKQDEAPAPATADDGGWLRSVKKLLDDYSYVYAMCCRAVNSHKTLARAAVRLGLKEDLAGFELLDDNLHGSLIDPPPPVQRAYEQIRQDLLRLDESVRSQGSRMVVAMIPALQAVNPDELVNSIAYTRYETGDFDVDQPYRILGRFLTEHGVRVVSPLATFREKRDHGTALYLPQDLHFSREGHRLFAEAVAPMLKTMLDDLPAGRTPDNQSDDNR
jgi:lysophospholipase L1-like esterase